MVDILLGITSGHEMSLCTYVHQCCNSIRSTECQHLSDNKYVLAIRFHKVVVWSCVRLEFCFDLPRAYSEPLQHNMDINPSLEKNPIRLRPHPTARDQAVAIININPGTVIFSEPVLVSALLPQAKTYRCDYCHRVAAPGQALKRCTGCLAYWYCNASCESLHPGRVVYQR